MNKSNDQTMTSTKQNRFAWLVFSPKRKSEITNHKCP